MPPLSAVRRLEIGVVIGAVVGLVVGVVAGLLLGVLVGIAATGTSTVVAGWVVLWPMDAVPDRRGLRRRRQRAITADYLWRRFRPRCAQLPQQHRGLRGTDAVDVETLRGPWHRHRTAGQPHQTAPDLIDHNAAPRPGLLVALGWRRPAFDVESNCQDMNSLTDGGGANVEHASDLNGPERA